MSPVSTFLCLPGKLLEKLGIGKTGTFPNLYIMALGGSSLSLISPTWRFKDVSGLFWVCDFCGLARVFFYLCLSWTWLLIYVLISLSLTPASWGLRYSIYSFLHNLLPPGVCRSLLPLQFHVLWHLPLPSVFSNLRSKLCCHSHLSSEIGNFEISFLKIASRQVRIFQTSSTLVLVSWGGNQKSKLHSSNYVMPPWEGAGRRATPRLWNFLLIWKWIFLDWTFVCFCISLPCFQSSHKAISTSL